MQLHPKWPWAPSQDVSMAWKLSASNITCTCAHPSQTCLDMSMPRLTDQGRHHSSRYWLDGGKPLSRKTKPGLYKPLPLIWLESWEASDTRLCLWSSAILMVMTLSILYYWLNTLLPSGLVLIQGGSHYYIMFLRHYGLLDSKARQH